MKINKLSLNGYKRIMLSDIRTLVLTVESIYQIILGTNGSGKSSLLRELSPLPANPADYNKGGMKEIEITHNNLLYILKSNFKGKASHSFIKDGIELNEGGTITVQKELVKQEFGINEEIHDLLTGKLRFTQMSPSKRREMITLMSDTDLTYAMEMFKKLSTLTRDNQGAINHLKNRISVETQKLMSIDTGEDLQPIIDGLQRELTLLMEQKRPDLPYSRNVEEKLSKSFKEATDISNDILNNPIPPYEKHYDSIDELISDIHEHKSRLNTQKGILEHQSKEYEKYHKLVGKLEEMGVDDIGAIEAKASALRNRISEHRSKINEFMFEGDVSDLEKQRQDIKRQIIDILSNLPDNSDKRFTRQKLTETEENLTKLRSIIDTHTSKRNRVEHEIEHILNTDGTTCPKCRYVWREGVTETDVDKLKALSSNYLETINKANKEYTKHYEMRESIKEYSTQYGRLKSLSYSYPKMQNLIDWLLEDNRILHQPSQYCTTVDRWLNDLHHHVEAYLLEQELKTLDEVISKSKLLNDQGSEQITDTLKSLSNDVEVITKNIRDLSNNINTLETYYRKHDHLLKLGLRLEKLIKSLYEDQELLIECIRSEKISEIIREHQTRLATTTQKYNEKSSLVDIIDDLKSSLSKVEDTHKHLKLLCKALSPIDGVIAHQMTSFIRCLVDQMNDIIGQIYTYPLQVKPCGLESNELDYKFPLDAGSGRVSPSDIKLGSEGQQEIVDFAFKLVASLYMGFNDYPLYIDELGRTQDETHLTNVMNYLKILIESNRHSQLFMISHAASGFGAFTQADYLVLNGANITVPQVHNQHVEIS